MKKLLLAALGCLLFVACAKPVKMGAMVADPVIVVGGTIDGGLPVNATFGGTVTTAPPSPCTPISTYGVMTGVVKDAGGLFFSASCYNTSVNTQFVQIQAQSTAPLQDAGLAPLEYPVPANGGVTIVDPPAPGGASFAIGIAFDVSGTAGGYYKPDGGTAVNCSFCFQ
jgi:hypothetical protein